MSPDALRQALSEGAEAGLRHRLVLPDEALRGRDGDRTGNRPGSSLDFHDYRDYQPGDDLRRIDWGVYARSDRLTVKRFRDEVSPHVDLVLDTSRSMDLPNAPKARAALGLCGLLTTAARNAHCTVTAWMQDDDRIIKVPHGHRHPTLWEGIALDGTATPAEALDRAPVSFRPRGLRVLVSDLLYPADAGRMMRHLSRDSSQTLVLQLLAAEDAEPPARGNLQLIDSETRRYLDVYVDAAVQERYRNALARHEEQWRDACARSGATFVRLIAESAVDSNWDLPDLQARNLLAPA